jgi:hypothetical protein
MTTATDTNVIIALWDKDPALSLNPLDAAFSRGTLGSRVRRVDRSSWARGVRRFPS